MAFTNFKTGRNSSNTQIWSKALLAAAARNTWSDTFAALIERERWIMLDEAKANTQDGELLTRLTEIEVTATMFGILFISKEDFECMRACAYLRPAKYVGKHARDLIIIDDDVDLPQPSAGPSPKRVRPGPAPHRERPPQTPSRVSLAPAHNQRKFR